MLINLLLGFVGLLVIFLLVILVYVGRTGALSKSRESRLKALLPDTSKKKTGNNWWVRAYDIMSTVPGVRSIQGRSLSRLKSLRVDDETYSKSKSAQQTVIMLGILVVVMGTTAALETTFLQFLATSLITFSVLSWVMDNRTLSIENQILEQQVQAIEMLKDKYQATKMITQSFEEVTAEGHSLIKPHLLGIVRVFKKASTPSALTLALEEYYKIAPNDFMRKLSDISANVLLDGDTVVDNRSTYLMSLSSLVQEINALILYRKELRQETAFMVPIAALAVVFAQPLKIFNLSIMPATETFYATPWGYVSTMIMYVLVFVLFTATRSACDPVEGKPLEYEGKVLGLILTKLPFIKKYLNRFAPDDEESVRSKRLVFKYTELLNSAGSRLSIHELVLKKLLTVVAIFAIVLGTLGAASNTVKERLVGEYISDSLAGNDSSNRTLEQKFIFEKDLIQSIHGGISKDDFEEKVVNMDRYVFYQKVADNPADYVDELWLKLQRYRSPVLTPWDVLMSAGIAVGLGYWMPNITLYIRAKRRMSGMQQEVDSLSMMLAIRTKSPNAMVKDLLEWSARYTIIFKEEFTRAFVRYDQNPKASLAMLRMDTNFFPMQRLIDKMIKAYEGTTVVEAFDSLEQDMEYSKENRKLDRQKALKRRLDVAQTLSTAPFVVVFSTIFLLPWAILFIKTAVPIFQTFNTLQGGL